MKDLREQIAALVAEWPHARLKWPNENKCFPKCYRCKIEALLAESKGSAPGEPHLIELLKERLNDHTWKGRREVLGANIPVEEPCDCETCEKIRAELASRESAAAPKGEPKNAPNKRTPHYDGLDKGPRSGSGADSASGDMVPWASLTEAINSGWEAGEDYFDRNHFNVEKAAHAVTLLISTPPNSQMGRFKQMYLNSREMVEAASILHFREECAKLVERYNKQLMEDWEGAKVSGPLEQRVRNLPFSFPASVETELRHVVEEAIKQGISWMVSANFRQNQGKDRPTLESVMAALRGDK